MLMMPEFIEEAQICAQLSTTMLFPQYPVKPKLPDGRFYFTMKVVEGRRLTDIIRSVHGAVVDGRLRAHRRMDGHFTVSLTPYNKSVRLLPMHLQRGLHPDLKPSNVMLGRFREVLVLDWGIAKVLDKSDK